MKNEPRLVAAARELRDRWLEQINSGQYLPMGNGKYEVSRGIGEGHTRYILKRRGRLGWRVSVSVFRIGRKQHEVEEVGRMNYEVCPNGSECGETSREASIRSN